MGLSSEQKKELKQLIDEYAEKSVALGQVRVTNPKVHNEEYNKANFKKIQAEIQIMIFMDTL